MNDLTHLSVRVNRELSCEFARLVKRKRSFGVLSMRWRSINTYIVLFPEVWVARSIRRWLNGSKIGCAIYNSRITRSPQSNRGWNTSIYFGWNHPSGGSTPCKYAHTCKILIHFNDLYYRYTASRETLGKSTYADVYRCVRTSWKQYRDSSSRPCFRALPYTMFILCVFAITLWDTIE